MADTVNYYFDKYFHIVTAFAILLVLLFFSADQVIGAAGLRAYYLPVGMGFGIGCFIWLWLVFRHNRMTSSRKLTYALIIACLIGIPILIPSFYSALFALSLMGAIISLLSGATVIPVYAIAVLMVGVVIVQLILTLTGSLFTLRKILSTLALLYIAFFSIGFASLLRYGVSILDERYIHDNQQYFLYIQFGWLDDADTLQLYECNSIGIACNVIYEESNGRYSTSQVSIDLDPKTNEVAVKIGDRISPYELTPDDAAYLCAFFQIPREDYFCSQPASQNYDGFSTMLTRKLGTVTYENLAPFFQAVGTSDAINCTPPNRDLTQGNGQYSCRLQFPDNDLYIRLRAIESSDSEEPYFLVDLINPDCHCENEAQYGR